MKVVITLFLTLFLSTLFGQTGTIRGTVFDFETGETIIGAPIYNQVKTKYTRTDFEGNYTLKLAPGKYWILCEYVGFKTDSVEVNVKAGEVIKIDYSLKSIGLIDEFVVYGDIVTGNEAAILQQEKNDSRVTDGISSEGMSDQGANNAADGASKTPGVTVEGGKYVYVRGLSDRYSKTTLNGAEVPGLDPNRNSVQMDLFPSNLIDELTVYKSFSPDLPASFTGGLVNIKTKDFPESFIVSASAKLGYNTQSNLNSNFLGQKTEGGLDFLGMDDGTRGIPAQLNKYSREDLLNMYPSEGETLNDLGKAFNRDFDPIRTNSGINSAYTFSIGNQIDPKKEGKEYPKLGYVAGISYRKNYSYYDNGAQGRYNLTGNVQDINSLNPELVLRDSKGEEDVLWGALGNFSVKLSEFHKLGLTTARFQNGVTSTRFLEGNNFNDANDLFFQTRTLFYQERALTTGQLQGESLLGKKDTGDLAACNADNMKMTWVASYTMSQQETPELKFFTNDYTVNEVTGDTMYDLQANLYMSPAQFYRYMEETNLDIKVNFEKPITTLRDTTGKGKDGIFKFGGSYVDKFRIFNEKRYDFIQQSGSELQYNGSVEEYMADENFDVPNWNDGFIYIQETTESRNSYTGAEKIFGAYAMGDFWATEKIKILVGARAELDTIFAQSKDRVLRDSTGGFNQLDILPSLNASYSLIQDTMKIRFAYTRTLARPTFRELAPFSSFDFVGGNVYVGNRGLQRTLVDNLDLRWELYPSYDENLSVGVFAKRFQNPIERAFNPEASNAELTWRNVDEARAYGAEIEFRKHFALAPKDSSEESTKSVILGGNFTYVYSEVSIPEKEMVAILSQDPSASDTRVMFGQAPYIVNGFAQYSDDETGVKANVNFGVSGEKLAVVTVGGTPNVFEKPRPMLGFNVSKKLGKYKQYSMRFSANNLLDSQFRQVYEYKGTEYIFGSYYTGRTFSLSLRYTFDKLKKDDIDKKSAQ